MENNSNKPETVDKRVRNWTCIVYPDSAPKGWEIVVADKLKCPIYISPLHDRDINADGSKKKPHYHVVFAFSGKKSYSQVNSICQTINATIPQTVNDLRGMLRYLVHKDNPEKAPYSVDDIRCLGGADYQKVVETNADRQALLKDMQLFCRRYHVKSFQLFSDYCTEKRPEWYNILTNHNTLFLKEYIKSLAWSLENEPDQHIVDPETGDIIF